jgi:integrase
MERLDTAPRYGTLIVTRDRLDRRRKVHLPWKEDHFRHRFADIREAAGIDFSAKFMGLRHGGSTESGNAELTDAQIRALSGHTTAAMTTLYTKATMRQRRAGARKRLEERTKGGNLSK